PIPSLGEHTTGLLVLKGHWDSTDETASLDYVGKVSSFDAYYSNDDAQVARLTRDGSRLYGAFACHGIAAYTVAAPGSLPAMGSLDSWPSAGQSAVKVLHGAGDRAYVTFLNDTVAVFDATDLNAGPILSVPTDFIPNALVPAPSGTSGP